MTSAFSVAFSPSGDLLALGAPDGKVTVVALASHQVVFSTQGHKLTVSSLAFSRQGNLLASGGWDSKIQIWNTAEWTLNGEFEFGRPQSPDLQKEHADRIRGISFIGDAPLSVSVSEDGELIVWQADVGRLAKIRTAQSAADVTGSAISQDGRLLALACQESAVELWDPESLERRGTLEI